MEYTYHCDTLGHRTWIDHIFVNGYDISSIKQCKIIPEHPDNTSDHLPVRIEFCIESIGPTSKISKYNNIQGSTHPNRKNAAHVSTYAKRLHESLLDI